APLRYEKPEPAPEESFRANAPESAPVPLQITVPWRMTSLPNGLRVALFERHDLPVATVRLVVERGSADVSAPLDAYATLAGMVMSATARRDEPALHAAWAGLGAVRFESFGPNDIELGAKVAAADLDSALALIAETATQPRLDLVHLS